MSTTVTTAAPVGDGQQVGGRGVGQRLAHGHHQLRQIRPHVAPHRQHVVVGVVAAGDRQGVAALVGGQKSSLATQKVFTAPIVLATIAVTRLESTPPESITPTGTSATKRRRTAVVRASSTRSSQTFSATPSSAWKKSGCQCRYRRAAPSLPRLQA